MKSLYLGISHPDEGAASIGQVEARDRVKHHRRCRTAPPHNRELSAQGVNSAETEGCCFIYDHYDQHSGEVQSLGETCQ